MKKLIIITLLMLPLSGITFAQDVKYQLSSHILDITLGAPAANVKISLEKMDQDRNWSLIDEKYTDENGRIKDFLKEENGTNHQGINRLTYFVEPYFKKLNQSSFYPFIEVVFEIKDQNHYHVPITLSAYGYSTYRGN
ncbi:MAG: hydroxyisourate hydrolase [Bacteroidales bacterium]|nr:hydroxyisourate hydrolase [Bacteroidales bacterium]MDD4385434.1 hydroxyisourate hydrolase [Bacteroidales bacterium]MDY0144301.1 hydroxyisourate hydrolase [Bacteroidales bacterium]